MNKIFWVVAGIVASIMLVLMLNQNTGTGTGWSGDKIAQFALLSAWAILIGSAVMSRQQKVRQALQFAVIWIAIIIFLVGLFIFRYDIQDIGSRFTGGLLPGSPISQQTESGISVTLIRSPNGHFEANGTVNNVGVRFLVDTGASSIILTNYDARRAGINMQNLKFDVITQTANGQGRAAITRIEQMSIGEITRFNVDALVAPPGTLPQNLLGQEFLESLSGYEKKADRLTLRD